LAEERRSDMCTRASSCRRGKKGRWKEKAGDVASKKKLFNRGEDIGRPRDGDGRAPVTARRCKLCAGVDRREALARRTKEKSKLLSGARQGV